ncbi:hypothetical protein AGMMS50225_23390 [Betaproteobacteria bacterium]|nr:hypothetical protein AGMMS50225_23390 [Betaproteobacteria bacterium]
MSKAKPNTLMDYLGAVVAIVGIPVAAVYLMGHGINLYRDVFGVIVGLMGVAVFCVLWWLVLYTVIILVMGIFLRR